MKTIEDYQLNIIMIFGRENYIDYIDRQCNIYKNCTAREKYISDQPIITQSDLYNPVDPYRNRSRYQNFNTAISKLANFCSKGFPDWVDEMESRNLPMLFWEPSSE